jgi:hypothetical protein
MTEEPRGCGAFLLELKGIQMKIDPAQVGRNSKSDGEFAIFERAAGEANRMRRMAQVRVNDGMSVSRG